MTASLEHRSNRCPRCGASYGEHARLGFCSRCVANVSLTDMEEARPGEDEIAAVLPRTANRSGPQTRFGEYELLEEIARGGMGVVYRARQRPLNRIVAVKLPLFGGLAGADRLRRFKNESAAGSALDHPHIVRVLDVGDCDGQPFIAMEFITGTDLGRLVRERPLPSRQAAGYVAKIARAVDFAHRRGVLHRDLKPSNILLDASDEPRVMDFGLARNQADDSELTVTGQAIGSPNFMPPEQAGGDLRRIGPRSDVYGLGAILYHLLTARPPFLAETFEATLTAVRERDPVPPRQLDPGIPRDLETVCLKCLEKDPAKRYGSAQELAEELDRFLKDEPIRARPVSRTERAWRWCRRKPALAGAYGLLFLLLLVILIGSPLAAIRINASRNAANANALQARRAQYSSDMILAHQAVQEGDFFRARQLLERHARQELGARSQKSEEGSVVRLPTPDSRLLASSPSADLRGWEWRHLWEQIQGEEKFILGTHAIGVSSVGFLPDGKMVFSSGLDKTVRLWNLESRELLAAIPQEDMVAVAAVSADGKLLVTATTTLANTSGHKLQLWDVRSRALITNLHTNHWPRPSVAFSPDGRFLAVATVEALNLWDLQARRVVTHWPFETSILGPRGMAIPPDSRVLAFNTERNGRIQLWNLETRAMAGALQGHTNYVSSLAFAPDGTTLASVSHDGTIRWWDMAKNQERARQGHLPFDSILAFSPDGKTLAVTRGQQVSLFDAAGALLKGQLFGHTDTVRSLSYSPDGRLLLTGSLDGTVRVWNADLKPKRKSGQPIQSAVYWETYGFAQCLSFDGRHALNVFTNDMFSVWDTVSLAESRRLPLPLTNVAVAAIAPGGEQVAFFGGKREIKFWDMARNEARPFATLPTNTWANRLAFSSDGKLLAVGGSSVKVFEVATARERYSSPETEDHAAVMEMLFAAGNRKLLLGHYDGAIVVHDLESRPHVTTLLGHLTQVRGLGLLPDGETLYAVTGDGAIGVWSLHLQRMVDQLQPRRINYVCAALSPDGSRFAAGAGDGIVTLWDTASRLEVARLKAHEGRVQRLAFTSDGNNLVSIGAEQLRVWRARPLNTTHSSQLPRSEKR